MKPSSAPWPTRQTALSSWRRGHPPGAPVPAALAQSPAQSPAKSPTQNPGGPAGESREPGTALSGLADGYIMAVALLVIGWVTVFGAEFHRSADQPGTFLLNLIHPLADLAVVGALLPLVTAAWRRTALPYLAILAVTVSDALAVGQRVSGGHPGVATLLMQVLAAALLGLSPWNRQASWTSWASWSSWPSLVPAAASSSLTAVGQPRRWTSAAAATIVAALTVGLATLVVIANGLADAPGTGVALKVAGGAGVLVLASRVFMLVNQNAMVLRIWRDSSRNLRDLANRTSDVVLVCDLDGTIRYASSAVADYGYRPRELVGKPMLEFVHPADRLAAVAAVAFALSASTEEDNGQRGRFPARVRAADGTWRHIESIVLNYSEPGGPGQMLVTVRDISDQVALRQQVAHLTFHDGLTGLPNRAYVEERARDALRDDAAAQRAGVIFLDLDRFTAVNNSVGHGAGNLVLAQAARRLRAVVPMHNTVSRWGSDEFAVLIENVSANEITEIAERMVRSVATEPFGVAGQSIALTASVGVAMAGQDPPGLVLRNADAAMSRAKETGGDRVEVYAAHMHADAVRRLELVSDLQQAITKGGLTLQYQPIVDLATSRVTGAEALVRWRRGEQFVPPREFLRVAEESGLIVSLGEWVLREACAQGASWRASSWDVGVSVNLSARQISAPRFPAQLACALADSGLPPKALTVEVNERILVEHGGLIVEHLAELHRLGVRLAIDDFGTGYASLAHLRQLPVDIIKIDPSFVDGLGRDDTLTLLTRTIVQVGRDLGMLVVAEGIEQPRQLSALREMGCAFGQGFLVARPMAAPGVEALIRTAAGEPSVSGCETTGVGG